MRFDNVKRTLSLFAVVAAVIVAGVVPARADVWIQSSASFEEACGVGSTCFGGGTAVDMMKVFIQPVTGVTFASPGILVYDTSFSWVPLASWIDTNVNPTYSNASGPAMTDFYYDLKFNIDQTLYPGNVAFNVDVYYFQNIGGTETLIDQAGLTYNDASSFDTSVNNWGLTGVLNPLGLAGENQAVPEPTSILLLGSVIFGLAIGLRKKLA